MKDYYALKQMLGVDSTHNFKAGSPPWWSGSVGEEVEEKDYLAARVLTSMAILNGPTDLDDIFSAIKQIKSGFKETQPDGYDPKLAQHPFSFLRGTVLHKYLNPNSDKCLDKKLAKKVINADVSLEETELGAQILKMINVKDDGEYISNIDSIYHSDKHPDKVFAKSFKSKNAFGDLTARALCRTSKLGVFALGGIGAIQAAHEINEGENAFKEIAKRVLQVILTIVSVGYLGAIGYKKLSAVGSLAGMGIGSFIGDKVPELLFDTKTDN